MARYAVGVKKELYGSVTINISDEEIEGLTKRQIDNLLRKKAIEYVEENGAPELSAWNDDPTLVNGVRIDSMGLLLEDLSEDLEQDEREI